MARKGYKSATLTMPDGTRKYIYAKTQEELDEKVFNVRLQLKMGVDLKNQTTVGELIKLWFETEIEPNVRNNTAVILKSTLNNHLMPMVAQHVAKDVTPMQVSLWLKETGKLNKVAARACHRALKNAFQIAEENGVVYKSPVLARYKPGGFGMEKREALTPEEEEELLRVVEPTRAYLLVWFLLATGARRGEACGLMWDSVDFDNATVELKRNLVSVGGKSELRNYLKTESSVRTVALPLDLRDALREAKLKTNSLFVFSARNGKPLDISAFSSFWKTAVHERFGPDAKNTPRKPGVVTNTKVTPHVLRHTYATRCFEAGMDIKEVQRLLGHSDPSITLSVYTHYCEESRREDTFNKVREARSRTTECTTSVPHTAVKSG